MQPHIPVLLLLFAAGAVALAPRPHRQDPTREPAATLTSAAAAQRLLLERCQRDPSGPDGIAARRRLEEAIGSDYAAAAGLHEQLLTELAAATAPEDARRWQAELLGHHLQLGAIDAAAAAVVGRVREVDAVQGGVVDYDWVLVGFADHEVLRADPVIGEDLRRGVVPLLRGTHRDTWLGQQLAANVERVAGPRIWLFEAARTLREGDADGAAALEYRAWTSLPIAALPTVRERLRLRAPGRR